MEQPGGKIFHLGDETFAHCALPGRLQGSWIPQQWVLQPWPGCSVPAVGTGGRCHTPAGLSELRGQLHLPAQGLELPDTEKSQPAALKDSYFTQAQVLPPPKKGL